MQMLQPALFQIKVGDVFEVCDEYDCNIILKAKQALTYILLILQIIIICTKNV